MSDLISRQALCEYALNQKDKSVTPNDIMRFPSAQPEIIHCRDCIHYRYADNSITQEHRYTCDLDGDRWKPTDFCSFAERKMRHDQGKSD